MFEVFLAIILATAGQVLVSRHDLRGLVPYGLAIVILIYTLRQDQHNEEGETHAPAAAAPVAQRRRQHFIRVFTLPIILTSACIAFIGASDNTFRWYGTLAWIFAIGLLLIVLWAQDPRHAARWRLDRWRHGLHLRWITFVVIGLLLLGFWFRFWQLDELPPEMTSDHVEKLLDVHDLVTGQRPIFLVRNTGREPWQFYWTLTFIRLFDLDTKFFALKLGTAVVGLITLPGVYLLGRDLFGRWVGLLAMLFCAVASWPVTLSRIGLRFPFAPAVTAWSLLFLLRGLRGGRRNDFLLLGLTLGIGMQGYTAFRAMPLAVVVCWGLAFVLQPASLDIGRSSLIRNALLTILVALVVFIPLGRFSLEHPEDFWQRSFSRIADPDHPNLDSPPIAFFKNLVNLTLMFHWQGDDVWVNTLINAPVLDPVLGGLLILGLVIVFWCSLRLRDPIPLLLLIAGVILLLPSALSLAYPMENPSVVRTGGAIPVVMIISALPVSFAIERSSRERREGWRLDLTTQTTVPIVRAAPLILGVLALAVTITVVNYRRYFVDYWNQYRHNAINTTEIASAIQGFVESGGDVANAWIIAWPYWVDTRGVGIELGDPLWNNVILSPGDLNAHGEPSLGNADRPRFYVLHPEDAQSLEQLHALFPDGWSSLYAAQYPERRFVLFYVPRTSSQRLIPSSKGMSWRVP